MAYVEGEVIARVSNVFGDLIAEYRSAVTGIVVGRSTNPICQTGARVAHIGVPATRAQLKRWGVSAVALERGAFVISVDLGLRFAEELGRVWRRSVQTRPKRHSCAVGRGGAPLSGDDELDAREHAALNAAISRSLDQAARGEVNPAEKILARLRERRR